MNRFSQNPYMLTLYIDPRHCDGGAVWGVFIGVGK